MLCKLQLQYLYLKYMLNNLKLQLLEINIPQYLISKESSITCKYFLTLFYTKLDEAHMFRLNPSYNLLLNQFHLLVNIAKFWLLTNISMQRLQSYIMYMLLKQGNIHLHIMYKLRMYLLNS
jgi:hypothetical protein